MKKELNDIKARLVEIANCEAMKLYRMARKLQAHGGSIETVSAIREEANRLYNTGYPERLLNNFTLWKYAFRN